MNESLVACFLFTWDWLLTLWLTYYTLAIPASHTSIPNHWSHSINYLNCCTWTLTLTVSLLIVLAYIMIHCNWVSSIAFVLHSKSWIANSCWSRISNHQMMISPWCSHIHKLNFSFFWSKCVSLLLARSKLILECLSCVSSHLLIAAMTEDKFALLIEIIIIKSLKVLCRSGLLLNELIKMLINLMSMLRALNALIFYPSLWCCLHEF